MASAVEVYQECVTLGVQLTARGGKLLYDGPATYVTLDLVQELKARKPELLILVRGDVGRGSDDKATDPINALYRRFNRAMPQRIHIPELFWCRLDPLQVEIHDAWAAGDAERVVDAIDNYETTVMEFFRQTVLARRISTR